jgi:hypothetical protein
MGLHAEGIDGDASCRPSHLHDFTSGLYVPEPDEPFRFDAVWSVEFLEHVEERYLPNVMVCLILARPSMVVASAAPPGKSGHHHVNLQPQEYWEEWFASFGYVFCPDATQELRACSTMEREFIRERGIVLVSAAEGRP